MENTCKEIVGLLVDYADGELSPDKAGQVNSHLQSCENCRNTFNALQKSLCLANEVWQEGLEEIQAVKIPEAAKKTNMHWLKYAAVAATITILATTFVFRNHFTQPAGKEMTIANIELRITEEGNAARLLAAAEMLAGHPEAQEVSKQQYRYIAECYPQTQAAAKARLLMK